MSKRFNRRRFVVGSAGLAATAGPIRPSAADVHPQRATVRNMHKYEDLRPEEFEAELARTPIVYWGCGPMEYHGLYNALGIDPGKAYEICLRAVSISGGIAFPMVPFAPAGAPPSWSRAELRKRAPASFPSVFVSVEVCEQLYIELMESLADIGFKVCMAFGGHGPAASLLKKIENDLGGRIGNMLFSTCGSVTYVKGVMTEEAKKNPDLYGHAGAWETSMNMAMCPEYVALDRISPDPWRSPRFAEYDEKRLRGNKKSNREFGERLLDTAAQHLAQEARELLANAPE